MRILYDSEDSERSQESAENYGLRLIGMGYEVYMRDEMR